MSKSTVHKQVCQLKEQVSSIESKLENVYNLPHSDYKALLDELFCVNSRLAICEQVLSSAK